MLDSSVASKVHEELPKVQIIRVEGPDRRAAVIRHVDLRFWNRTKEVRSQTFTRGKDCSFGKIDVVRLTDDSWNPVGWF